MFWKFECLWPNFELNKTVKCSNPKSNLQAYTFAIRVHGVALCDNQVQVRTKLGTSTGNIAPIFFDLFNNLLLVQGKIDTFTLQRKLLLQL